MKALTSICSLAVLGLFVAAGAPGMSDALKPVADPGIYSGLGAGRPLTFFVTASRTSLRDVAIPLTDLACAPRGGGANDYTFFIAKALIKPGGAFSAKGVQSGFFAGAPAQFSYVFAGRLTKATKVRSGTGAGTFRTTIRYTDTAGVNQTCTTNTKSWTATRSGPKLKAPLLKAGNYTGLAAGRPVTFTAAPGRITTVAISLTDLACSPRGGGSNDTTFAIPQLAVRPDGSFSQRASTTGVFAGKSATFTYSFSGQFEGLNSSRVGSVTGTFREDIAYTDTAGVKQTCTTNTRIWTAARSS